MATIKNTSDGPRGFWKGDALVLLEKGEVADDVELTEAEAKAAKAAGYFSITGGPLDHDDSGKAGGSRQDNPPALTGKNKAELLEIAKAEGVDLPDDATNDAIREAIEAKRKG